jgi:hypothetical protein
MWTNPLDLLVQRFPGSSALAASTILGETPTCVAVHARVLRLVDEYDDALPLAERLRRAVPGPDTDLTALVRLEPLLGRLDRLLEELAERPCPARRLTRRLDAVLTALESCSAPRPRSAGRRGVRPTVVTAPPLRRVRRARGPAGNGVVR